MQTNHSHLILKTSNNDYLDDFISEKSLSQECKFESRGTNYKFFILFFRFVKFKNFVAS